MSTICSLCQVGSLHRPKSEIAQVLEFNMLGKDGFHQFHHFWLRIYLKLSSLMLNIKKEKRYIHFIKYYTVYCLVVCFFCLILGDLHISLRHLIMPGFFAQPVDSSSRCPDISLVRPEMAIKRSMRMAGNPLKLPMP